MAPFIGTVNNRQILYYSAGDYTDLATLLPNDAWMLFAIADQAQVPQLNSLAKICLDKGVLYVCAAGEAGSQIDHAFDMEIVNRKVAANDESYEDTPMTTWHTSFEEGFWFAATLAYHDTLSIKSLLCINLTEEDYREKLTVLISKINNGWIPED